MKNTPSPRLATRMFPIGTAACSARWIAALIAGTALLNQPVLAVNNYWTGSVSNDWNNAGNWSLGRVPVNPNGDPAPDNFDDAVVDLLSPAFPLLNTSPSGTPRDVRVGSAAGADGRLDQSAGVVSTGNGNWMFVGVGGGQGEYNLADTAAAGGTFTGFGTGSGSINAGGLSGTAGRLYVGGDDSGNDGGTGILNISTTGTVTVRNDLVIGSQSGTGTFNLDAGTVTTGGWNYCGDGENSLGTFQVSGGSLANTGNFYFGRGGTAVVKQTGGTVTNGGEVWFGNGATGSATFEMSGGSFAVNGWLAVGRESSQGTFSMTGGTLTKTGGGSVTLAALGTNPRATVSVSGGLIDVQSGEFLVGETGDGATAELTLSGSGEIRTPALRAGVAGAATGTVNLNGGTLRTAQIAGGAGMANAVFDGTQIVLTSAANAFLSNFDQADLGSGGLKVDTNDVSATSAQPLAGTGGVTKSGAGRLSLTGYNTFEGPVTVSAGSLALQAGAAGLGQGTVGSGALSVANGAELAVTQIDPEAELVRSTAAFGNSTFSADLGNFAGNPSTAPLNVTGALTLSGTLTINITDQLPVTGTIPLIRFASKTGGGTAVLGTLPPGVVATLVQTGTQISLSVTSVAVPYWDATQSAVWDTTTPNWVSNTTNSSVTYSNGNPVLFNDLVDGPGAGPDVVLNTTVTPGAVNFENEFTPYTLQGAGKISGTTGLTKTGAARTEIGTLNDFSGRVLLKGGVLAVNSLANGGAASGIGASPAGPASLVIAGGGLEYTGTSDAVTDRGFTVGDGDNAAVGRLIHSAGLTFTGPVVSNFGKLVKSGEGALTLTHNGANVLAKSDAGGTGSLTLEGGTLALAGAGAQTNSVTGDVWVGSTTEAPAHLTLEDTTLNVSAWLAVSRGNGSSGFESTLTAVNSTVTSGNFAAGFANGVPGHSTTSSITFTDSTFTNTGSANVGESGGNVTTLLFDGGSTGNFGNLDIGLGTDSNGTLVVTGNATVNAANRVFVGNNGGSNGTLVINGSGVFNRTGGWMSVGGTGNGTLQVSENGRLNNAAGDFNVTDLENSRGTLTLEGSGAITAGPCYFGKGANTIATVNISGGTFTGLNSYFAQTAGSVSNVSLSGGTLNLGNNNEIFMGASGRMEWTQTAGTFNCTGWTVLGRFAGGEGYVNISGGTFAHTMPERNILVGEEGTGVLTISGSGAVTSNGNNGVVISNGPNGSGTINLEGGSLTVKRLHEGSGGTSSINLNGGLLRAAEGAAEAFIENVDSVTIGAGGAFIDSNGQTIAIATPLEGTSGGLTKSGAGELRLNGTGSYTGATTVSAGTLGGNGTVAGPLSVPAGATLAPGSGGIGTFTAGAATVAGTLAVEIDGALADQLAANGTLNVSAGTLAVSALGSGLTEPAYIIARYTGATPAPFAAVTGAAGYTLDYAYDDGVSSTNIALVSTGAPPYTTWIDDFFPGETDPSVVGPGADPDNDGWTNAAEFLLGGIPDDSSVRVVTYPFALDSDADADEDAELILTVAVPAGMPAFAQGGPASSATYSGIQATVEGSTDLGAFTEVVTPVAAVTTGLPPAPAGYQYRSFSISGPEGTPARGFLRVRITP